MRNGIVPTLLIVFYKFWHGILHLKGAGFLIRRCVPHVRGLHAYRLTLPEGQEITVDFRDVSAMFWLNHVSGDHRFEENGLVAAVTPLIEDRTIVWDCGANCGMFSYRIAKETSPEKIFFFEPNPAIYKIACAATAPFKMTQGFQVALSDKAGELEMTIPDGGSCTGTLEALRTGRVGKRMRIKTVPGDQLVEAGEADAPHLIKIDTEGHEISVIRGLATTIAMHKPYIFFEHISFTDSEIIEMIPDGYTIYSISDCDGSLRPGFNRSRGHNSLLIPEGKAPLETH